VPLAKRFQVESLRLACVEAMEEDVTVETACALFEEGRRLLNEAHFGLKFIEENTSEVIESAGFMSLSRDALMTLLRSPNLTCGEADLFDATMRWAKAEADRQGSKSASDPETRRQILGEALNLIRFPAMTMTEVCTKVQPSQILSAEDLLLLFTWLGANKDSKPKIRWPTREREGGGGFKGSTILDAKLQKQLRTIHKTKSGGARFELTYKGKTHGLDGYTFHAKCDTVGPTLVVIKQLGTKQVFGGYTEQSWNGSGYKSDAKAYLFSLNNRYNKPVTMSPANQAYTISCNNTSGPCFGGGNNIYCAPQMATNSNYQSPHNSYVSDDNTAAYSQDLLASAYNFTVEDIEVYAVKKTN